MQRNLLFRYAAISAAIFTGACSAETIPDAYGNFESIEVVVSAQTAGQLRQFTPSEGMRLERDAVVALVDTLQLSLERAQLVAQRLATGARRAEVDRQVGVLAVQRDIALRTYERTQRLHEARAATAQQLEQAERDYRTLVAQIGALQAQRQSVDLDVASTGARVAVIDDRVAKSSVVNPVSGTVLAVYVHAGELVQPGQALYRIANLDTLVLRAYVSGAQLASLSIGRVVSVNVDHGSGELRTIPGTLSWISPSAEFTPTPVQTRDDRADLVYAVKILVPNTDGSLRIGMPADVILTGSATPGANSP